VTEPREIGTALTRRPEPPKVKPVLSWSELLTIAWLRVTEERARQERAVHPALQIRGREMTAPVNPDRFVSAMEDRWLGWNPVASPALRRVWAQFCQTFNEQALGHRAAPHPVIAAELGAGKTRRRSSGAPCSRPRAIPASSSSCV
jgi:hypothetical protein